MFSDLTSTPQPQLADQPFPVWVGAMVGGGSLVNGMEFGRGSVADYDAWEQLGNDGWGWDSLFTYFKKSSSFTPNPPDIVEKYNYTYDEAAFGGGPVQASFPDYQYPELPDFWDATAELGLVHQQEGAAGVIGAYWAPHSKDPVLQTRSSARTAYYDPINQRPNLSLLTGHYVQEIILEQLTAKGVKVTSREDGSTFSACAGKEVILAAGAVHTPQILQLSGIGPKSVLKAAGIETKLDLPAVGSNFQDHAVAYLSWNFTKDTTPNANSLQTDPAFNQSAYEQYVTNKTGPYTKAHGNGVTFLSLKTIAPDQYEAISSKYADQNATQYLPSIYSQESTLLAGYLAQQKILAAEFASDDAAVYEFPFDGGGAGVTAMQKPTSRGTVFINSTNPYGPPIIDYYSFANPVDTDVLDAGVAYTRKFFSTNALAKYEPVEVGPSTGASGEQLLNSGIVQPSFAHPSCTCAMMPQEQGGCVDAELKVYGVQGLRIVDASIMPLIPACHLQGTVYAIAEKAADLILG